MIRHIVTEVFGQFPWRSACFSSSNVIGNGIHGVQTCGTCLDTDWIGTACGWSVFGRWTSPREPSRQEIGYPRWTLSRNLVVSSWIADQFKVEAKTWSACATLKMTSNNQPTVWMVWLMVVLLINYDKKNQFKGRRLKPTWNLIPVVPDWQRPVVHPDLPSSAFGLLASVLECCWIAHHQCLLHNAEAPQKSAHARCNPGQACLDLFTFASRHNKTTYQNKKTPPGNWGWNCWVWDFDQFCAMGLQMFWAEKVMSKAFLVHHRGVAEFRSTPWEWFTATSGEQSEMETANIFQFEWVMFYNVPYVWFDAVLQKWFQMVC